MRRTAGEGTIEGCPCPAIASPTAWTPVRQRRHNERDGAQDDPLHGRPVAYVQAGSGPVLLLIHGMAGTFENWRAVIEPLARSHTVVAPDLPGHGASAPGAGDYSLGALAAAPTASSGTSSSGWWSGRGANPAAPSRPTNAIATGATAPRNAKSSEPHEHHGCAMRETRASEQHPPRSTIPESFWSAGSPRRSPRSRGRRAPRPPPPRPPAPARAARRGPRAGARESPRARSRPPESGSPRSPPAARRPSATPARAGRCACPRGRAARPRPPPARARGRVRGAGRRRAWARPRA